MVDESIMFYASVEIETKWFFGLFTIRNEHWVTTRNSNTPWLTDVEMFRASFPTLEEAKDKLKEAVKNEIAYKLSNTVKSFNKVE